MSDKSFKELLKRPRGWFLALTYFLTLCFIALAIILAVIDAQNKVLEIVSYLVYALSATLLSYSVYTIVIYGSTFKQRFIATLKKNRFIATLMENYSFKTLIFSFCSFAMTVAFAIINLVGAIIYGTVWYASISAYYFVLILFRGGILLADRKFKKKFAQTPELYEKSKWQIYLFGGAFLSLMEIAMAVAVTQMMLSKKPMQDNEIMAICTAAYTFYKITMAIYNLIKARKFNNPVVQALRNINFADACMSMVSLTVLLLSTFSEEESGRSLLFLKASVGFASCLVTLALACLMVIHACKRLKKLKEINE